MPTPLPIIADNYLITQFTDDSVELHSFNNVFCVLDNTAVATHPDIADALADAYKINFLPIQSTDLVMGKTNLIKLDGISATETFVTDSSGTAGGHATGSAIPNAIAYGITWQTGLRGKSKRGRSYLPGVKSDAFNNVEGRTLTPGFFAALQVAASGFLLSLATGTPSLSLVVLSRKLGSSTFVTHGRANSGAVEQRRRYERVAHR